MKRGFAKPFIGVSAYAANDWDGKTTNNYFKCFPNTIKRPATAVLWGTWGAPVPFIKRFINWAGERPHCVEIHISNECARRTNRNGKQIALGLGTADYNNALKNKDIAIMKQVQKRVELIIAKIQPLCKEKTKIILCTGLEDNIGTEAAENLVKKVQAVSKTTGWIVCRNPMGHGPGAGTAWVEGHGRSYNPAKHVWNFDGVHVGSINSNAVEDIGYSNALLEIKKANSGYQVMLLWSALAQGWKNQPAQPYEGRTFIITQEEQEGYLWILKETQG